MDFFTDIENLWNIGLFAIMAAVVIAGVVKSNKNEIENRNQKNIEEG